MTSKNQKNAVQLTFDQFGNELESDTLTAVVALFCLMSVIDNEKDEREYHQIISNTTHEFGIPVRESAHYHDVAEFLLSDRSKVDEFIEKLNAAYDENQRAHFLKLMWDIACADGVIRNPEKDLFGELQTRLELKGVLPS